MPLALRKLIVLSQRYQKLEILLKKQILYNQPWQASWKIDWVKGHNFGSELTRNA